MTTEPEIKIARRKDEELYSKEASDAFDKQLNPLKYRDMTASEKMEARAVVGITGYTGKIQALRNAGGQLEQESGDPEEYLYAGKQGIYHHYWAIINGGWNVIKRPADANHPANGPWDPWKNPPEGVEPPAGGGLDPFNW